MSKVFEGKVLFLDRSDINTDEIIPAKYLTEVSKLALGEHLLEDLSLDSFDPQGKELQEAAVVISRENFGCGSSREHAPWAFEVNGYNVVIAQSFARIFRQNMFNCGMLAIEASEEEINKMFSFVGKEATIKVDVENDTFEFTCEGETLNISYDISGFDKALVKSGGWIGYADANY